MRFKRNYVTIVYSFVFILLMLLCALNVAAMSYEYFSQDGMGVIFSILMTIGIILIFIAAFFMREKAILRGIQREKSALIIFEGVAAVVLVIVGFCLIMDHGMDAAIWFGVYLAVIFGTCRMLGGRLCGLLGLVFSLALTYFAINTGWVVFDSNEILGILCILVPFFVFLVIMKNIIPQFGQSNAVVIFALVVLCALFGAFICLNPLAAILCLGCGLSLLFANIRSVDTLVTKGPFMAGFIVGGSAIFTVIMSFLLEKNLGSLLPAGAEPGFSAAAENGDVINYFIDKIHNMLVTVLFHAFDFGIFSIILLIFATMAGVYAIRRKLSSIGPILLCTIFAVCGYAIFDLPETHGYYLTYMTGLLAAYGLYNMLLPEFLTKYDEEDEDEEDLFDTESDTDELPVIDNITPDPVVKEKVADENRQSSSSESEPVAKVASAVDEKAAETEKSEVSVNVKDDSDPYDIMDSAGNNSDNFMEWHVSNEFIRDDELRKQRQAEREKDIEVAQEQKEAKEEGKSEKEIQAIAEAAEEEKKQSAPGRVLFTGEDMHPSAETIQASIPPMSIRPADQSVSAETKDVSQLENVDTGADDQLHGSNRAESDTIVLSGYQNSGKLNAPVDVLTAIKETEIPQVEIPDVPEVESPETEDAGVAEVTAAAAESAVEANEAAEELSKAAAAFGAEGSGGSVEAAMEVAVEPTAEADVEQASLSEDEKLDNLLDRLDVSDSIKRMSEIAREDMADVIEHADDKFEDEVVLKNEDYQFGTSEGEYGEVPTISGLEDRWRAEEQLKETPDDMVPDVVSAEESKESDVAIDLSADNSSEVYGKGEATTPVSLTAPENANDPSLDMLSFDSVANTSEERLDNKPSEPENEDVSLDHMEFMQIDSDPDELDIIKSEDISDHEEDIAEHLVNPDEESFMSIDDEPKTLVDDLEFVSVDSDSPQIELVEPVEPIVPIEPVGEVSEPEEFVLESAAEDIEPDAASTEPEFVAAETEEPKPFMFMPAAMEEVIPEQPEEEVVPEPEPDDSFVSFRDMATATVPEEILPEPAPADTDVSEEPTVGFTFGPAVETPHVETPQTEAPQSEVPQAEAFTSDPVNEPIESEKSAEQTEPKIFKFEPERIERTEDMAPKAEKKVSPSPVINHAEQSPVFSFTKMDADAGVPKESDEHLFIPKPGEEPPVEQEVKPEPISGEGFIQVDDDEAPEITKRPVPVVSRPMRALAAELDETIEKKKDRFHTEEVVTRTNGGSRSYHKIVIK